MSIVLNLPMVVARNPIARAIERTNLRRWFTDTALQVQVATDGQACESLLIGLSEALGIALKATEGFDDPEDVRGPLLGAMGRLVDMTNAGRLWDTQHAEPLCEALDIAVQLLACADPADKLKAWKWVMRTAQSEVTA